MSKLVKFGYAAVNTVVKHRSQIYMGLGLGMFGVSAGLAARAAYKTSSLVQAYKEDETHTKEEVFGFTKDICKEYAPAVGSFALGTLAVLASYKVVNAKYVAALTAAVLLEDKYARYRVSNIGMFGIQADDDCLVHAEILREDTIKKHGPDRYMMMDNVEEFKERVRQATSEENEERYKASKARIEEFLKEKGVPEGRYSEFGATINRKSSVYIHDEVSLLHGLSVIESLVNGKLQARGYLFLNEVYERLGLPQTREGQVYGWLAKDSEGNENRIDFGLSHTMDNVVESPDEVLCKDEDGNYVVWVNFNVTGNILTDI